jgi:tetratricopeptide (TPR) repeat protein
MRKAHLLLASAAAVSLGGGLCWLLRSGAGPSSDHCPEVARLEAAGDIARALEEAERLLALRPSDRGVREAAARLRFLVGDFRRGEELYRKSIEGHPRPAEAWVALARLEEDAGLRAEAAASAREAAAIDADVPGALAIGARCLTATRRYEEALALLEPRVKAGKADREDLAAYGGVLVELGRHREAADILLRALSPPGSASYDDRCRLAEALIGAGEHGRAADLLADVLIEAPDRGRAYFLLGTALARAGRREAAMPMMNAYRDSARDDGRREKTGEMDRAGLRNRALYERASVDADVGRFAEALAGLRKALALRPADPEIAYAVAFLLKSMEATVEARGVIGRAIASGTQPLARFHALLARLDAEAGLPEKAAEGYDRCLALDPRSPEALLGKGRILLAAGKPAEAEAVFRKARDLSPGQWEPVLWLGRASLERGDLAGAQESLVEAEKISEGGKPDVRTSLGILLVRMGRRDEGMPVLLEALKADPLSADALKGLEEGLRVRGDADRAGKAAERRAKVEAVEERRKALRASPSRFEGRAAALLEIADLLRSAGAPGTALRYAQLARGADPRLAEAHRLIAELAQAPEQAFVRAGALAAFLEAVPADAAASIALARTFARIGVRLDRAEELARAALRAAETPEARAALEEVLQAKGTARQ